MKKAGLVLEGGANRGVFTAGALDFLMEKEYYLPYVVGTSAGACNAAGYVSRQPGRMKNCSIITDKQYRYVTVKNTLRTHTLLDMDMVFEKYPEEIFPFDYDTYFQSKIHCEMVATNCLTGKAEYLSERTDRKRLMDICRASSSLPLATKMVMVDGKPYLDGGLADSVPIIRSLKTGHSRNVIILTRNKGYRKKESSKKNRVYELAYGKKYPNLVKALKNRAKIYNRTMDYIEQWESEGKVFVIRPEMEPVARLERDLERMEAFYQHGYEVMAEEFERMKWFLER
ncbi:MAG: patatin family protein [Clostridiales bacterium]|nr:patatin family protein [Clostridiales bacterium]